MCLTIKISKKNLKTVFALCIVLICRSTYAEIELNTVYPNMLVLGDETEVTLNGNGFEENHRVSIYLDSGNEKAVMGSVVRTTKEIFDIKISGNIAYMACGGGMETIDISNPFKPEAIGSINHLSFVCYEVEIAGNFAYLIERGVGMRIIDISDPKYLSVMATFETDQWAYGLDLDIEKKLVYIACGISGLIIVDIFNPLQPETVSVLNTPVLARKVAVLNNYAYVADLHGGLHIIDVSRPDHPEIMNTLEFDEATDIVTAGDYAYVVDGYTPVIVDISNPLEPSIVQKIDVAGSSVHVKDDRLYIVYGNTNEWMGSGYGYFNIVDISNPQEAFLKGTYPLRGLPHDVFVVEDKAYVVMDYAGLDILNVANPVFPNCVDSVTYPNQTWVSDMKLFNDTAYVASNHTIEGNKLMYFDISDPDDIKYIEAEKIEERLTGISTYGNKAYVSYSDGTADGGFYIFDISEPLSPSVLTKISIAKPVADIDIFGSFLYLDIETGFQPFDISDPSNPYPVESIDYSGDDIFVNGNTAYISAGNEGLFVVDLNDPSTPVVIDSDNFLFFSAVKSVEVVDDIAYASLGHEGLFIFNIGSPEHPEMIKRIDTPGYATDVTIDGDKAFIADGGNGFRVVDISDPNHSATIGEIHTKGFTASVHLKDDLTYTGTLTAYPAPIEITQKKVLNGSNMTFAIPEQFIAGNYTIRVFNENEYAELPGAVTFTTPENAYILDTKALIIAGTDTDNNILTQTKNAAEYAYKTLLYQGYTHESILFLSPDESWNGADKPASHANIKDAFSETGWIRNNPPAAELVVYLVDHGKDSEFIINGNEKLTASELDGWLDELQNDLDKPVIVIYDACQSGTFIPRLKPPEGKERIVITSASDENAYFIEDGEVSFSWQFWDAVFRGKDVDDAFNHGKLWMEKHQTPRLDANGNGIPDEPDDFALADGVTIRRGYPPQIDVPFIFEVSDSSVITDEISASLYARISHVQDGAKIQRVWAYITPPNFDPGSPDTPVTELPEVDLSGNDGDGKYEGKYDQFTENGEYRITFCAMNEKGIYATPRHITITRDSKYIIAVSPTPEPLSGSNTTASIWAARNSEYAHVPITRVWAGICPPSSPDQTVDEIDLDDPQIDGIYEKNYSGFTEDGVYKIWIYAEDADGYTAQYPEPILVNRNASGDCENSYETNDAMYQANIHNPGQTIYKHEFCTQNDNDWIKFRLLQGEPYCLYSSSDTDICDPKIEMFIMENKEPVPAQVDITKDDLGWHWECPEERTYYVNIENTIPNSYGPNVTYDLNFYRPFAGDAGTVEGTVTDPSGVPVSEAWVFTDDGGSNLSLENGSFSIHHPTGSFQLFVEAEGYDGYETDIVVLKNETLILNITLSPVDVEPGDVNGDRKIDLEDALLALRIAAGESEFSGAVCRFAHVNQDLQIGLEEALFVLNYIAGIEP